MGRSSLVSDPRTFDVGEYVHQRLIINAILILRICGRQVAFRAQQFTFELAPCVPRSLPRVQLVGVRTRIATLGLTTVGIPLYQYEDDGELILLTSFLSFVQHMLTTPGLVDRYRQHVQL